MRGAVPWSIQIYLVREQRVTTARNKARMQGRPTTTRQISPFEAYRAVQRSSAQYSPFKAGRDSALSSHFTLLSTLTTVARVLRLAWTDWQPPPSSTSSIRGRPERGYTVWLHSHTLHALWSISARCRTAIRQLRTARIPSQYRRAFDGRRSDRRRCQGAQIRLQEGQQRSARSAPARAS